MSGSRTLDGPRIARARRFGKSKQEIAVEMGLSVHSIAASLRELGDPAVCEPEADVRARWQQLLPTMKERLRAEIAR